MCSSTSREGGGNKEEMWGPGNRDSGEEGGGGTYQDHRCTADLKRNDPEGKGCRASGEIPQVRRKAEGLPHTSDHVQNKILC